MAADVVMARIAGLSPALRRTAQLMVVQAYFDESGSNVHSPVFAMGGFISTVDRWAAFSLDWEAALAEAPALDYFRMNEAHRLKEQFGEERGWDEELRDKRVNRLCEIICDHAITRVDIALYRKDYDIIFEDITDEFEMFKNPYFALFMEAVKEIGILRWEVGDDSVLEYIFDELGTIGEVAVQHWPVIKAAMPFGIGAYVGERPIHQDDKKFLPLQAADLYAWQCRRYFRENMVLDIPAREPVKILAKLKHIERKIDREQMRSMVHFAKRALEKKARDGG
jgi:hypothetical protein